VCVYRFRVIGTGVLVCPYLFVPILTEASECVCVCMQVPCGREIGFSIEVFCFRVMHLFVILHRHATFNNIDFT